MSIPSKRTVTKLLADHIKSRSPAASFVAGAAYVAVPRIVAPYLAGISPGLWYVFWLGVSIVANAILCWPLRSYRKAFINTLAFTFPNVLWFGVSSYRYYAAFPPSVMEYTAMVLLGFTLGWIFDFGLLSGIIWYRRKYQPVFPVGHCRKCGYNLTGLPSPRCPECGTGFEVG